MQVKEKFLSEFTGSMAVRESRMIESGKNYKKEC